MESRKPLAFGTAEEQWGEEPVTEPTPFSMEHVISTSLQRHVSRRASVSDNLPFSRFHPRMHNASLFLQDWSIPSLLRIHLLLKS